MTIVSEPRRVYVINGFEIPEYPPTPYQLVLTWKSGKQSIWPATHYTEVLDCLHKIHLRPDLMQRIEVCPGEVLWDVDWPQERFRMPPVFLERMPFYGQTFHQSGSTKT